MDLLKGLGENSKEGRSSNGQVHIPEILTRIIIYIACAWLFSFYYIQKVGNLQKVF